MINTFTSFASSTPLQRFARYALVVTCVALAAGLVGTAVVQGHDSIDESGNLLRAPRVSFVRPEREVFASAESVPEAITLAAVERPTVAAAAPVAVDDVKLPPAPVSATATATPRIIQMEVTAYCPCTRCCGKNAQGITASGKTVSYNNGRFVAADTRVLPFGKKLIIPGYAGGAHVEVIDRGGAIKGNKLDVFFPTHEEALKWGRQKLAVMVID